MKSWDWPLLYYTGTVILKKSTKEFWRMRPALLSVLTDKHIEINNPEKKPKVAQTVEEVGFLI